MTTQELPIANVPYYKQERPTSCGAACIRMLLARDGIDVPESELRNKCMSASVEYPGIIDCRAARMTACLREYGYEATTVWVYSLAELLNTCLKHGLDLILLCHPVTRIGMLLNGHYVLVTHIGHSHITVHDPDAYEGGRDKRYSFSQIEVMSHYTGHPMDQLGKDNIAIVISKDKPQTIHTCQRCGNTTSIASCVTELAQEYVCEPCSWWLPVHAESVQAPSKQSENIS